MPLTPEQKRRLHLAEAESGGGGGYVISQPNRAAALEAQGWEVWLRTIFPFAFSKSFAPFHREFWDLWWEICLKIRDNQYIEPEKLTILYLLGRALGKSSTGTPSTLMKAAIVGQIYSVYLSEVFDQAAEHLDNVRYLIMHPNSRLAEFYPHLTLDPKGATSLGLKGKDAEGIFITVGGSVFRAFGLDSSARGIGLAGRRPDDYNVDDVDNLAHSVAVSHSIVKKITRNFLMTQDLIGDIPVTTKVLQNLIIEHGFVNQVYTNKTDALNERTVIGVINTFEQLNIDTTIDATGKIKHTILPSSVPTWEAVTLNVAQKILNLLGLEGFMAECQNDFSHQKSEKVFHEYDEARQFIRWSDFERVFGSRYIPPHWKAKASADLGFSKASISSWLWVAAAAQNSPLPARYFAYRSKTFVQDSIDDQAIAIWEAMFPDLNLGKRHFEATQNFTQFPELFRLLNTKPRCREFLKDYVYNALTNAYEDKPAHVFAPEADDDDKATFYVKLAEKTFKSQIVMWTISHEKTGEQKTLAQKYGIPVQKTKHFGADDGAAEANHLLRGDYTMPHPFYDDEIVFDEEANSTGLYRLGCPYLFFIVDDEQLKAPRDDRGMKTFREQVSTQLYTIEKVTETGLTRRVPMKVNSDSGDALRMFASDYVMPAAAPLTKQEVFVRAVESINPHAVIRSENEVITVERQMQIMETRHWAKEKLKDDLGLTDDEYRKEFEEEEDVW